MTTRNRVGVLAAVVLGFALVALVVPAAPFSPLGASIHRPDSAPRAAEVLRPRTYTLTVTGDVGRVDVSWSDGRGGTVYERGTTLPWNRTVTTDAGRRGPLIALGAVAVSERPGALTCRITRAATPVDERTGGGVRPFANCHGV